MKRICLLILLYMGIAKFASAQNILWEKKIGWNSSIEQFEDGVSISDTEFIAMGLTDKFGLVINNDFYRGVALMRFDQNGDTSWLKSINVQGGSPKMIKTENNLLYVVTNIRYTNPSYLKLTCINFDGQVLFSIPIPDTDYLISVSGFIKTNDGNLILAGSRRSLAGTGNQVDMYGIKLDYFGNVIWNIRSSIHPYCLGNNVEETPEGHYVLSGTAGARIRRVEVDSAGNVLSDDFLYQTPSAVNFDEETSIKEHTNSTRVLSGNLNGSSSRYYFGYYQSISNQKIWGGEQGGGIQKPYIHNDGTILQMRANFGYWFNKYNPDSTVNWSITFSGRLGAQNFFLNKAIYLPDSSAIFVGKIGYNFTNAFDEFYFCRISNVGVPYDPSVLVSTLERRKADEPMAYPNPTESSLVWKGLKEEGSLSLFNLQGQLVRQIPIQPYQRVYLQDLPSGLYPYRIQTRTGIYSGKLVKN